MVADVHYNSQLTTSLSLAVLMLFLVQVMSDYSESQFMKRSYRPPCTRYNSRALEAREKFAMFYKTKAFKN
jgi:hypothetical protein